MEILWESRQASGDERRVAEKTIKNKNNKKWTLNILNFYRFSESLISKFFVIWKKLDPNIFNGYLTEKKKLELLYLFTLMSCKKKSQNIFIMVLRKFNFFKFILIYDYCRSQRTLLLNWFSPSNFILLLMI